MNSTTTAVADLLATRSDVFTAAASTSYVAVPGGNVVHTPTRRDFHFGNLLQLDDPPTPSDLDRWIAVWRSAFGSIPGIERLVIQWEAAAPVGEAVHEAAALRGCNVETDDVLRLTHLNATHMRGNARQVRHPSEWGAVARLLAGGHDELIDFYLWRTTQSCDRIHAGQGQWWGIYEQEQLLAAAGIFWGDGLVRFQNVVTHPDHRQQGLASSLLGHLIALHHHRGEVVIVAEAEGDAGRLYRRLGFRQVGVQQSLVGDCPPHCEGAPS